MQLELDRSFFIALRVDVSIKNEQKLFPVLIWYFLPLGGVCTKITDYSSLPRETSDLQCAFIQQVIKKYSLSGKIVGICAANTNTNVGGARRCGKNNLW